MKNFSNTQKKIISGLLAVILIGLIFTGCRFTRPDEPDIPEDDPEATPGSETVFVTNGNEEDDIFNNEGDDPVLDENFRAVWVASVLNLDFPSRRDLNAVAMKREIDDIVSRTVELGLNAIIFQVRPTGDSFYQSDIFPWSHWLSGTQGQGIPDFDPLLYWIEACHANDIELHAWLNPYRIIHTSTNSSDPNTLSPDNPVFKNPGLAVGWTANNGNKGLFLDPGLPEARQLIIDGIIEIITKYDVDGIHIDDYFYPGVNFDDSASFELFGNGMELSDWRRENVNTLIKEIQSVIRIENESSGKNIRWGISPSAIWMNSSSDPLGVPVPSTFESYKLLFADTRLWVTEEWVDYICPQIYWYIGFETADFSTILDWWKDITEETDVDLYIGLAAYRENENDQPPNWEGEMIRQLELIEASELVKGSVFYRFHSLRGALGNTIRDFFVGEQEPREPVVILDTLSVGMPADDVVINISSGSTAGYNVVGTSVPGIPLYLNGEEVINRTIEGFFFTFVSLSPGDNVFTFSQEGQDDVVRTITRRSGGGGGGGSSAATVTQVTSLRYATVSTEEAWLFPSNTISGGSDWMLSIGQVDRIVAESSNNYYKLSNGMWVNKNAVTVSTERNVIENVLRNGTYRLGSDYDIIAWQADVFPAIHASYNGDTLRLNFGMQTDIPYVVLPGNITQTIFSGYSSGIENDIPYYEFNIRSDINFEGYYFEYEAGEVRLYLKKRKPLAQGDKPLAGISIVLDPGHGGEASGAIGPFGPEMAEKHLNLINTFKLAERLEELGAEVHLTRTTDIDVSLQERVNISNRIKPDLFISLHINSVAETTNAQNIRGFTVWYRNPNTINISQTILDVMFNINPNTNRHKNINQANLFVCRPAWTPSVLLEAGFIINIDDFVWLIDPLQQDKMADATVNAILEYFAG